MSDKEQSIISLYKKVKDENDHLKRQIAILQNENETYVSCYGDNVIPASEYKAALDEMRKAKRIYEEKAIELSELMKKYKEEISGLLSI